MFAVRHSLPSDQVKHPKSNSPRRLPVVHKWRGRQIIVECSLKFLVHSVYAELVHTANIFQAPNLVNCILIYFSYQTSWLRFKLTIVTLVRMIICFDKLYSYENYMFYWPLVLKNKIYGKLLKTLNFVHIKVNVYISFTLFFYILIVKKGYGTYIFITKKKIIQMFNKRNTIIAVVTFSSSCLSARKW